MTGKKLTGSRRHRYTVSEFHRMAEAGIFREDDRVELIQGEIIDMAPIGSRHAGTVAYSPGVSSEAPASEPSSGSRTP